MTVRAELRTYYGQLGQRGDQAWRHFWLAPRSDSAMSPVRFVVGCFSGCYFLMFLGDLLTWFGPQGLWPRQLAAQVATNFGTVSSFRFSLLQLSDHPLFLWVIAGLGIVNSALLIWGVSRRSTHVAAIVNALLILSFVHRAALLTGAFEAVLSVLCLYLCICPGAGRGAASTNNRTGALATPERVTIRATVAMRLIQIHLSAAYFVGGCSMLAADVWWDGTAVWWLVTLPATRLLELRPLFLFSAGLFLVNALTHAVVVFHFAFPVFVWCQPLRRLMVHLATVVWPIIALLSGQWAYGLFMVFVSRAAWLDAHTPASHNNERLFR